MAIKKRKTFFVCMLVAQCKILQIVNILSKAMQCKTIDLISAHKLLQTAAEDIVQFRRSFDGILIEASTTVLLQHGVCQNNFSLHSKKTKAYFDEISEEIT